MCIIFNHDDYETSDTIIVVAPEATPNSLPQRYQLTYLNTVKRRVFAKASDVPPVFFLLAIPNPHGLQEHEFPLYPLGAARAQTIVENVNTLIKPYSTSTSFSTPHVPETSLFGASSGNGQQAPPLKVQSVGSYSVCVAPTLSDLETRAPWRKFKSLSEDGVQRVLRDIRTRYAHQRVAFVIAEGELKSHESLFGVGQVQHLQSTGFGVGYADERNNGSFFPTSHEPPKDPGASSVTMDVTCVALNAVIRPLSILPVARHVGVKPHHSIGESNVILRVDDSFCVNTPKWPTPVRALFNSLPRRASNDANSGLIAQLQPPRLITLWNLRGAFPNRDVTARLATDTDVAVAQRTLLDVDSWIRDKVEQLPAKSLPPQSFYQNKRTFSDFSSPVLEKELEKLDFVLALVARQLAAPGIVDRFSDAVAHKEETQRPCGPVTYFNLDLNDVDIDEDAYAAKEAWARSVKPIAINTTGTTYVRISAMPAPFESLSQRTVQPDKEDGSRSNENKSSAVVVQTRPLFMG